MEEEDCKTSNLDSRLALFRLPLSKMKKVAIKGGDTFYEKSLRTPLHLLLAIILVSMSS